MNRILVTGATGFVGRFLCNRLLAAGYRVRGTLLPNETAASLPPGVQPTVVQPLGPDTDWGQALEGVDGIVHLAARVHVMNDQATDPLSEFRRVNTAGSDHLARQAARAGASRLVFVSSIKVNGEESAIPYTEASPTRPSDPYGISKFEAERALREIEAETGLEVVVVRPTLVYGPGVKANFLKMMTAVERGIPLPLSAIENRRSLIYVGNLVDALTTCVAHPKAAGNSYLVSDGDDVSTPELVRRIARGLGRPARIFPVPSSIMRLAGRCTGKGAAVDRLLGSLTVDSSRIRTELGWSCPFTMEQGLRETAAWFERRQPEQG